MYQSYYQAARRNQVCKHSKKEIPTCFRRKTFWNVVIDYALTTASLAGLFIALLFVILL